MPEIKRHSVASLSRALTNRCRCRFGKLYQQASDSCAESVPAAVASLFDERISTMIGTLCLAAALAISPTQVGELKLTNQRMTYGELGAVRPSDKYLPNDLFFVAFDIDGITVDADGKVKYVMSMVVTDKNNKDVYKPEKPAEREEVLPLGGSRLPARAFVLLKPDQEPGTYTCKVSVTDKVSNVTKVLEQKFDVVAKTFGLVALYTTSDMDGNLPAPPSGVIGQNLFIQCALVGFDRKDKKPNAQVELRIFDENNKPTLAKATSAAVPAEAPEGDPVLFRFLIPFNREGTFTAEVKATDLISAKTSIVRFPIKISGR
jgi:hypothetical protein